MYSGSGAEHDDAFDVKCPLVMRVESRGKSEGPMVDKA